MGKRRETYRKRDSAHLLRVCQRVVSRTRVSPEDSLELKIYYLRLVVTSLVLSFTSLTKIWTVTGQTQLNPPRGFGRLKVEGIQLGKERSVRGPGRKLIGIPNWRDQESKERISVFILSH